MGDLTKPASGSSSLLFLETSENKRSTRACSTSFDMQALQHLTAALQSFRRVFQHGRGVEALSTDTLLSCASLFAYWVIGTEQIVISAFLVCGYP